MACQFRFLRGASQLLHGEIDTELLGACAHGVLSSTVSHCIDKGLVNYIPEENLWARTTKITRAGSPTGEVVLKEGDRGPRVSLTVRCAMLIPMPWVVSQTPSPCTTLVMSSLRPATH